MKNQYRIVGRLRKNEKRHVVDQNAKWTREEAEARFLELKEWSEYEMRNRTRRAVITI